MVQLAPAAALEDWRPNTELHWWAKEGWEVAKETDIFGKQQEIRCVILLWRIVILPPPREIIFIANIKLGYT